MGTEESTTLTLNRGRSSRDAIDRVQWEARGSEGTLQTDYEVLSYSFCR